MRLLLCWAEAQPRLARPSPEPPTLVAPTRPSNPRLAACVRPSSDTENMRLLLCWAEAQPRAWRAGVPREHPSPEPPTLAAPTRPSNPRLAACVRPSSDTENMRLLLCWAEAPSA